MESEGCGRSSLFPQFMHSQQILDISPVELQRDRYMYKCTLMLACNRLTCIYIYIYIYTMSCR